MEQEHFAVLFSSYKFIKHIFIRCHHEVFSFYEMRCLRYTKILSEIYNAFKICAQETLVEGYLRLKQR